MHHVTVIIAILYYDCVVHMLVCCRRIQRKRRRSQRMPLEHSLSRVSQPSQEDSPADRQLLHFPIDQPTIKRQVHKARSLVRCLWRNENIESDHQVLLEKAKKIKPGLNTYSTEIVVGAVFETIRCFHSNPPSSMLAAAEATEATLPELSLPVGTDLDDQHDQAGRRSRSPRHLRQIEQMKEN